jgi:hypothetical protein
LLMVEQRQSSGPHAGRAHAPKARGWRRNGAISRQSTDGGAPPLPVPAARRSRDLCDAVEGGQRAVLVAAVQRVGAGREGLPALAAVGGGAWGVGKRGAASDAWHPD